MPLLPLWSGIILRTVNSGGNVTDSNAIVENWFRIVKHSIFNSVTGIQAADFIRTIYTNIDDKIAAFKFAFTPLAHKVLNLRREHALRMKRNAKKSGLDVRKVNLVILNQILKKSVKYLLVLRLVNV